MLSTWPELGSEIEQVFAHCGSALHYAGRLILTGPQWRGLLSSRNWRYGEEDIRAMVCITNNTYWQNAFLFIGKLWWF